MKINLLSGIYRMGGVLLVITAYEITKVVEKDSGNSPFLFYLVVLTLAALALGATPSK